MRITITILLSRDNKKATQTDSEKVLSHSSLLTVNCCRLVRQMSFGRVCQGVNAALPSNTALLPAPYGIREFDFVICHHFTIL